jgi:hypothetical protein
MIPQDIIAASEPTERRDDVTSAEKDADDHLKLEATHVEYSAGSSGLIIVRIED